MKTFWIRTASGAVYASLMIFCTFAGDLLHNKFLGIVILSAFMLFVAIGGMFEFYRMSEIKGVKANRVVGYLLGVILFCLAGSVSLNGMSEAPHIDIIYSLIFACPLLVMLFMISKLWSNEENPVAGVGATVLGVLYVAVPLAMIPVLCSHALGSKGVMLLFLMVWINDSFAYMGGSLLGRHKLWVRHSPGKTWEGCVCGLIFTFVAAAFLGPWMAPEIPIWFWLVCAFVTSVIGTLGDLTESMLKRSCGLKDSGNIMPGHGGFLDRFDSILAIMPFIFVLTLLAL